MRVLIVSSGVDQKLYGVSPFVYEQAVSLIKKGIDVDFFTIEKRGFWGYLLAVLKLNILLIKSKSKYDLIHAHYILAGLVASLQFFSPIILTLIGSDVYIKKNRVLIQDWIYFRVKKIIFVSNELRKIFPYSSSSKIYVIPYGVDLDKYYEIDKSAARKVLGWQLDSVYILFASRFDRPEKNYPLAIKSIERLEIENIFLLEFKNIPVDKLVYYYNASDLFLMTSIYEGSPQSIKEAMACNLTIVSTKVGDVNEHFAKVEGCYIAENTPDDIANSIKQALETKRSKSRNYLLDAELDSASIAKKIIKIYSDI